jgi:hypothetical protein
MPLVGQQQQQQQQQQKQTVRVSTVASAHAAHNHRNRHDDESDDDDEGGVSRVLMSMKIVENPTNVPVLHWVTKPVASSTATIAIATTT